MALKRRTFLSSLSLAVGSGALWGCSSVSRQLNQHAVYAELASTVDPQTPKPVVMVLMPETPQTKEVWSGLSDELGKDFALVAVRSEGAGASDVIAEGIRRHNPVCLVLMNNPTVAAYRAYQKQSGATKFPPAIIVMTSFLDGHPTQVMAATGISYEVPLITVVTNLRKLIASPIERIGVIRRAQHKGFVERQLALAKREQIQLVEQEVTADPNAAEIKWALRSVKHRSDALWILNDDRLLTPRLIGDGWLPGLNEKPYCPTIVGAASLVSPALSFGSFAVLPDHTALGVQVANVVFGIADAHWELAPDVQVDLPLSTTTTIDLVQAQKRFPLRQDALRQVDRILDH